MSDPQLVMIDPAELVGKMHPKNPQQHPSKQIRKLVRSMERFGFTNPILVDADDRVLAGHARITAAVESGLPTVPIIRLALSGDDADAYLIADNRLQQDARWNNELLADLLGGLRDADYDLSYTGFDSPELQAFDVDDDVGSIDVIFDREQIIEVAIAHFEQAGFPYPEMPLYDAMQEINALARMPLSELLRTRRGYHVMDLHHRHRFSAHVGTSPSPVDSFHDPKKLRAAINLVLDSGEITANNLRAIVSLARGTQAVANFRPGFAAYIYKKFAVADAVVLDTSAGYGGRLVGFMASSAAQYIGVDPNAETQQANERLARDLGFEDRVELIVEPIEDVDVSRFESSCDLHFTSPPYFTKEHYADDDSQSFKRYPDFDDWADGFLRPMIEFQFAALTADSYNVVNIADVKIGKVTYPLEDRFLEIAKAIGFEHEKTIELPMPRALGGARRTREPSEPVFVMHKPARKTKGVKT